MGDVVLGELLSDRGLSPAEAQEPIDLHLVAGNGAGQRPYADALRLVTVLRRAGLGVAHAMNAERYLSQATRNQVEAARKAGATAAIHFTERGDVEATSLLGSLKDAPTHRADAERLLAGDAATLAALTAWLRDLRRATDRPDG
jgi:hypothetical protein